MSDNSDYEHSAMVAALKKDPLSILESLSPKKADLLHMGIGIAGEAVEILDGIKKHIIHGKPLDRDHVIEELGDIEFFLEGIRQTLDVTREETLANNIRKLSKRYASGRYSDEQAQARADVEDGQ